MGNEANKYEGFNDKFINLDLDKNNIDIFFGRTAIKKAINTSLKKFSGTLVDLGCGKMPYRSHILNNSSVQKYIEIDIQNPAYQKEISPDLFWDGKTIPLDSNNIDTVIATNLFEHLPDINIVLKEINRILKPGATLFFTVPFLWPLHDAPYDEYRYTPFALQRHFKETNFNKIQINANGGWNASLAVMIGLWLKRSKVDNTLKEMFADELLEFYKFLIENDKIPNALSDQMISPGYYGTVEKKY